ncbi:MAG: LytTR family transcriptional regulator DNA-binding domain-containing protein, partial [Clostridiales bacterium]|nr:LytTR family transcriptional regulator DNA-binding domain-containing protein [Clostridiales bacterium]
HILHYHTRSGEYVFRGTMQSAEAELTPYHFARCNHWYLVNLAHVSEVNRDVVTVAGSKLEISRRNKASFLEAVTSYVGGNT